MLIKYNALFRGSLFGPTTIFTKKNLGKRNLNLELFLCDREPCLNGGKCVADTDKSTTTCVCSSIYDGDKCECKSN